MLPLLTRLPKCQWYLLGQGQVRALWYLVLVLMVVHWALMPPMEITHWELHQGLMETRDI